MATATSIQWTDYSSNPIRARLRDGSNRIPGHYCQKISSGCASCYASRYQPRVGMPKFGATGPVDPNVELFLYEKELQRLLRSRKISGKRVFVGDMTDIFGHWVPFEMLDKLFAVFALRSDVTFQVLTKRPEQMSEYAVNPGRLSAVSQQVAEALENHPFEPNGATDNPEIPTATSLANYISEWLRMTYVKGAAK